MQNWHSMQNEITSFFGHDACLTVLDMHVWYFTNGVSKHTTSHHDLFSSLEIVSPRNTLMCANNSSYLVKEIGKFKLVATNGSTFMLIYALYVPRIGKNLLPIFVFAKLGLVVKFVDDRCIVHNPSNGDIIMASSSFCIDLMHIRSVQMRQHVKFWICRL